MISKTLVHNAKPNQTSTLSVTLSVLLLQVHSPPPSTSICHQSTVCINYYQRCAAAISLATSHTSTTPLHSIHTKRCSSPHLLYTNPPHNPTADQLFSRQTSSLSPFFFTARQQRQKIKLFQGKQTKPSFCCLNHQLLDCDTNLSQIPGPHRYV